MPTNLIQTVRFLTNIFDFFTPLHLFEYQFISEVKNDCCLFFVRVEQTVNVVIDEILRKVAMMHHSAEKFFVQKLMT